MSYKNKLKFGDTELTTPEHDAIMFWLNDNCVDVVKKLFEEYEDCKFELPVWEKPFTSKHGAILCFIDLSLSLFKQERPDYRKQIEILFEVKPKIQSLGELIRQMNAYKQYVFSSGSIGNWVSYEYIVISPDDAYAEILAQQGIHFYKVPEGYDQ